MQINQITNAISRNDAVSNQLLAIKNFLRQLGHDSTIYVKWKDNELKDDSIVILPESKNQEYKIPTSLLESDIVFYHHSYESLFLDLLKKLDCKKILYYHNITPPIFFKYIDPNSAKALEKGLLQLEQLKSLCSVGIGSEYNKLELERLKFSKTFEIPYYFDHQKYSEKNLRLNDHNKIYDNIIFVGRNSPNKKQDDLIKIFYYYSNFYNPNSRLFLTGNISFDNPNPYESYLILLIKKLDLEHKVIFTGMIQFDKLISLYKMADIFVCMSEHEGFCVPIIESMMMNVPVIAYNSTSIPYTMKNSGILIDNKDHKLIAKLIWKILRNKELRLQIINEQSKYVNNFFTSEHFKNTLTQLIQNIINA